MKDKVSGKAFLPILLICSWNSLPLEESLELLFCFTRPQVQFSALPPKKFSEGKNWEWPQPSAPLGNTFACWIGSLTWLKSPSHAYWWWCPTCPDDSRLGGLEHIPEFSARPWETSQERYDDMESSFLKLEDFENCWDRSKLSPQAWCCIFIFILPVAVAPEIPFCPYYTAKMRIPMTFSLKKRVFFFQALLYFNLKKPWV